MRSDDQWPSCGERTLEDPGPGRRTRHSDAEKKALERKAHCGARAPAHRSGEQQPGRAGREVSEVWRMGGTSVIASGALGAGGIEGAVVVVKKERTAHERRVRGHIVADSKMRR